MIFILGGAAFIFSWALLSHPPMNPHLPLKNPVSVESAQQEAAANRAIHSWMATKNKQPHSSWWLHQRAGMFHCWTKKTSPYLTGFWKKNGVVGLYLSDYKIILSPSYPQYVQKHTKKNKPSNRPLPWQLQLECCDATRPMLLRYEASE